MIVDLDRKDLEALIEGSSPNFDEFNNPLVKRAGHSYWDQSGRTCWDNLSQLSEEELYALYLICKNSWVK